METPGNSNPTFVVAVGYMEFGSQFVQFGQSILDTGKVNGSFTATFPPAANNQVIHLFVGNGTTVEDSTMFVILKTTTNTTFPADVSAPGGAFFNARTPSGVTLVDAGGGATFNTSTGMITFVPEPSGPLLGLMAVGTMAFRRRRRA